MLTGYYSAGKKTIIPTVLNKQYKEAQNVYRIISKIRKSSFRNQRDF